ncbi:MAG: hypothetical protein JWN63_573 [Candidatus Acidoferrum typicum]|nr:hypothetical protein [Candidatus Acidoferrum typicum]
MLSTSILPDANATSQLFSTLYVSPTVRDVKNQDGAVLLDLQQGICFGMTPVGMQIWDLLKTNQSLDQICDHLCSQYPGVTRECIAKDAAQFVQELLANCLVSNQRSEPNSVPLPKLLALIQSRISASKRKPRRPRRPRLLFCKALLGLAAFDLFRFGNNFSQIYGFVRGWDISNTLVSDELCEQVCKAVNHACVWYPKRVLCLQRSTVTTCLLRHCGVRAELVLGAQKFPFKAHAWTEVNRRPLNERRDVQQFYMVWERC